MAVTPGGEVYESDVQRLRNLGLSESIGNMNATGTEILFHTGPNNAYTFKVKSGTRPSNIAPPTPLWSFLSYAPPQNVTVPSMPQPEPTPNYTKQFGTTDYIVSGDKVFLGGSPTSPGWSVLVKDTRYPSGYRTEAAGSSTAQIPESYLQEFGVQQRQSGGGSYNDIKAHGFPDWMVIERRAKYAELERKQAEKTQTAVITNPARLYKQSTRVEPKEIVTTASPFEVMPARSFKEATRGIEQVVAINPAQEAGLDITGLSEIGKTNIPFMSFSTKDIMKSAENLNKLAGKGFESMGLTGVIKSAPPQVGSFVSELVMSPGSMVSFFASIPFAAEVTSKKVSENPTAFPSWLGSAIVAGGVITGKQAVEDPFGFAGNIVGTTLMMGSIKSISTKATGIIRTTGKEYIPIEKIGYDVKEGFPISERITEKSLIKSFEKNTLVPEPSRMSISGKPPSYVPETARLPTDFISGKERIMWTGWEKTPSGNILSGGKFTLEGGSSEIPGMYGAPVAESYFTKTGTQMPNIIGFDTTIIKRPSLIHTTVFDIKPTPELIRSNLESVKRFASEQTGGNAIAPLMKSEYEIVLPEGNVLQLKQTKYFTKLGGFGEKHIFGTRVPIIEAVATGEKAKVGLIDIPSFKPSYYKGQSLINLSDALYSTPFLKITPSKSQKYSSQKQIEYFTYKPTTVGVTKTTTKKISDITGYTTSKSGYSKTISEITGSSRQSGKSASRSSGGSGKSSITTISRPPSRVTERSYMEGGTQTSRRRSYTSTLFVPEQKEFPKSKTSNIDNIVKKQRFGIGDFAYRELSRVLGTKSAFVGDKKRRKRR